MLPAILVITFLLLGVYVPIHLIIQRPQRLKSSDFIKFIVVDVVLMLLVGTLFFMDLAGI
jgi:hypothetical protein